MRIKIVIDCVDLQAQADFWSVAADCERVNGFVEQYQPLRPRDDPGTMLVLQRVPETKAGKNRLHLDLHPADGPAWVDTLEGVGATRLGGRNTEYLAEFGTTFQVMADPEGNEFCVVWRTTPQAWD
jgi:glyoxalase superfamily protein